MKTKAWQLGELVSRRQTNIAVALQNWRAAAYDAHHCDDEDRPEARRYMAECRSALESARSALRQANAAVRTVQ